MTQHSLSHSWWTIRGIFFAVIAVATPALLALGYYFLSGSSGFGPMDITAELLIEQGITVEDHRTVYGLVTHDGSKEHEAQARYFAEMLIAAFRSKGVRAKVDPVFREGTRSMNIYFIIDGNRIGPFDQSNVPDGIALAAETLTMAWEQKYGPHKRDW